MLSCKRRKPETDYATGLITTQIDFGLAYIGEAQKAYSEGNYDYGEVARKIAMNAYAASIRFSADLLEEPRPELLNQLERLEVELDRLSQSSSSELRSIA